MYSDRETETHQVFLFEHKTLQVPVWNAKKLQKLYENFTGFNLFSYEKHRNSEKIPRSNKA